MKFKIITGSEIEWKTFFDVKTIAENKINDCTVLKYSVIIDKTAFINIYSSTTNQSLENLEFLHQKSLQMNYPGPYLQVRISTRSILRNS